MSTIRIIGIDPGLANTGIGIIDAVNGVPHLVTYGVIETKTTEEKSKRLLYIYNNLSTIIDQFKPHQASMESLFFAKNVTSAMPVAEARGVITLLFEQKGVPLTEYTPNTIKLSVTGTASADKKLVEQYVKILLRLKTEPKPDHAADALAGAITHLNSTERRFLRNTFLQQSSLQCSSLF